MPPFYFFLLAIITPFLLCVTLLVPPYLGMLAASYIIYYVPGKPNPLDNHLFDVFYIIDVYANAFNRWLAHTESVSFFKYTLPLVSLPAISIAFALWITRKFMRSMTDIFHSSSSGY